MKKNIIAAASLAVAALAALSCSKEADVKNSPAAKGVTIQVVAEEGATKTYVVDGEIPTVEWSGSDYVSVFEVVDGAVNGVAESDFAVVNDGKTSFKTILTWDDIEGSSYQYSAVYPAKSVVAYNGKYYIVMPDYQALEGNNFSANSDILFSTPLDHGSDRVTDGEDLMFSFRRLGTVVRLTLNGIPTGEKIHQVTVNAPVNIAGAIVYDPATSTVDAKSAFEASASKTVTLGLNGGLEATGNDVVWFRVMSERAWAAGETASFEVITDKGTYKKEVTLPSDIKFPDGGLTKFGVGLAANKVNPVDVPFLWDFEDGADGWTFIDNDGDGYNWFPYAVGGISGNNSLVSQSYANAVLYPDNWAFSPAVQLTEDTSISRRILLSVP